jgi:DNA mismatch repair protein MutL
MLVIDQHALHERILYEHNKARLQQGALESQPLLVPEPVDLLPEQAAVVIEHREPLANLGLGIEEFGGNTLLVTRYPTMWKRSPTDLVKSVADHLATSERAPTPEVLLDGLLKMTACKAAVKAGDRLSNEEIASLIEQRHLVADTHHCPHGRPTALFFSKHDLDRQFKRT